jgi:hypothetical protein
MGNPEKYAEKKSDWAKVVAIGAAILALVGIFGGFEADNH